MSRKSGWTFVTNHAVVLIQVAQNPDITVRAIAEYAGITERATHRILAALIQEGYVSRRRVGRNNYYFVNRTRPLRHPEMAHMEVGRLLNALSREGT